MSNGPSQHRQQDHSWHGCVEGRGLDPDMLSSGEGSLEPSSIYIEKDLKDSI